MEITFSDGCPVRVSSDQALAPAAITCLEQRLDGVRWECAIELPCLSRTFIVTHD